MFDRAELNEQLQSCADIDSFQDWFEEYSWNIHQTGDDELIDAVFRIESWLTARDEDRLKDEEVRTQLRELAKSIPPFLRAYVVRFPPSKSWVLASSSAGSMDLVGAAIS
jgi:hypothetical protein